VFLEIDQSEKEVPVVAMFVNGSGRNSNLYPETSDQPDRETCAFLKVIIYSKVGWELLINS
jgi:hypothetical protein